MNPSSTTRLSSLAALSTLTALLAACGGGGGGSDTPVFVPPPPPPAPAACVATPPPPAPAPGAEPPQVTLAISNGAGVSGNLVLTLNPTAAPVTTANFLAYVNAGFYNCTVFHRHVPNFIIQGGGYAGPLTATGTATEKPPLQAAITLEDNVGLSNAALTIAMARLREPVDSATSQFFFNLVNNPGLDRNTTTGARGYAVFGSITAGAEVLTAMRAAPCTAAAVALDGCLPVPNITITSAAQTR